MFIPDLCHCACYVFFSDSELMEFLPQTRQTYSAGMIYFNVKLSKHTTLDSQHILVFDTVSFFKRNTKHLNIGVGRGGVGGGAGGKAGAGGGGKAPQ